MILTGLIANHTVEFPKVLHVLEEKTILKAEDVTPALFFSYLGGRVTNSKQLSRIKGNKLSD